MGRGYLPWMERHLPLMEGVPTLDGGNSTYLGWERRCLPWMGEEVPALEWERGYLPLTGYAMGSTPLAASHRRKKFAW